MEIVITGHRPNKLGGYTRDAFERLVSLYRTYFEEVRPTLVHSGMALGADQAAALACVMLKVPFIAHVPFPGQDGRWPERSRVFYRWLLPLAQETRYVTSSNKIDDGAVRQLFLDRNLAMLDALALRRADGGEGHVLALWDGSPGGTGHCVRHATDRGLPIVNLWDRYLTL